IFYMMLILDGNTAPYLLYAYPLFYRVLRKLATPFDAGKGLIVLAAPQEQEQELAARPAQFTETLNNVAEKGTPLVLCAYPY
ncbi:arginine--tRNA ligase, partial [Pseudomonas syringae pv. tagetis]